MADTTDSPKKKPMVIEGYQVYSSEGTVKPVFSDHIRKSIFLTDDCLLLHGSSAEMRHESSSALLSFSNKQPPVKVPEEEMRCVFDDI